MHKVYVYNGVDSLDSRRSWLVELISTDDFFLLNGKAENFETGSPIRKKQTQKVHHKWNTVHSPV